MLTKLWKELDRTCKTKEILSTSERYYGTCETFHYATETDDYFVVCRNGRCETITQVLR